MAEDVRRIVAEFTARNKAAGEIAAYNRSLNTTRQTVMRLGQSMLQMAGVGGGMYAVKQMMTSSVHEFASYEEGLAKISTMLKDHSMKYLPEYDKKIRQMAKTYGESKESMVAATYQILSGQIAASKAMGVLEQSVRSAKGGFTDAGTTTMATIRILNAYSMEAEEAARVNNVLHATVQQGLMDYNELATHIGDVIGTAAALDVELEAVTATLATMTRTTLPLDKSVVALRNILDKFKYIDPFSEQEKIANELGFSFQNTSIKGAGLIEVFEKMQKANARQLDILMPSIRGFAGFSQSLKHAGDVHRDYNIAKNETTLAEKNLAKAMNTTQTQLDITSQYWKEFKTIIGENVAEPLNIVLPLLNELIDSLDKIPNLLGALKAANWGVEKLNKRGVDFIITDYLPQLWAVRKAVEGINKELNKTAEIPGITTMNEAEKRILEAFKGYEKPEITPGTEGAVAQIEAAKKQIADAQKLIETTRKSLITRLTLTAKFYEDMGDYGKDYLKLRERLLDQQVAQYKETINDEVLLGRWKESELEKIEKDITEIHRQETIKRLKESDKIKDGFKAAYMEEGFQLKTWGDIGYDVAYALRDSIAGSLRDIIMESKNATEAMKGFGLSIADAIVQIMAMEAAKRLVSGAGNLFGIELAAGKHGGGMGYERPSFVEAVPASFLARAPSLHTGTDEYYAKLKYNEGVFTPGQMKNLGPAGGNVSVNVNVINNSSQPVNAKQEKTSFDGKGYTIAVVLEDLRQNGPIRKSMRRGR